MASDDLEDALRVARQVAAEAATLLRGARAGEVRHKGNPRDLVTEWDTRSEELIRARLGALTPAIPVVGEEAGGDAGAPRRWLVDPIDGTVNFAHGLPLWTVSIALEGVAGGEVGVVTAPALDWAFWARRGGGAHGERDGEIRALAVSAVAALDAALLVTGFPYDRATAPDNNFAEWEHFQRRAGACRRLGAASLDLCLVASGALDGYWERRLHAWDVAAGALIVAEAGGRVTDTRGGPFAASRGEVVASNGAIHDMIVRELAAVRRGPAAAPGASP
ncbi:MAG: inositol monophosphatase [Kofleriaceae bacterium]|nr:inositol monophosphatase [Kofleriaceae bacterium]MCL4225891.1 inositol monophosphatase [Myxococcales bacterium]